MCCGNLQPLRRHAEYTAHLRYTPPEMPEDPPTPDAWVKLPTQEQMRALVPAGGKMPYDFGFLPAMMRLVMAHGRLGPAFGQLFAQIMFSPEGALDRREREMVAAVAAAAQDCRY